MMDISPTLTKKGCFKRQAGKRGNSNGVCTVLFRREKSNCSTVVFQLGVFFMYSGGADVKVVISRRSAVDTKKAKDASHARS